MMLVVSVAVGRMQVKYCRPHISQRHHFGATGLCLALSSYPTSYAVLVLRRSPGNTFVNSISGNLRDLFAKVGSPPDCKRIPVYITLYVLLITLAASAIVYTGVVFIIIAVAIGPYLFVKNVLSTIFHRRGASNFLGALKEDMNIQSLSKEIPVFVLTIIPVICLLALPSVMLLDVLLATVYITVNMENTKFLLYFERLRLITEATMEALPTALVQLFFILSYDGCFNPNDKFWAYISILVSVVSLIKNFLMLRRGARQHGVSFPRFLKVVFQAGVGSVPYLEAMRNNSVEHVTYAGLPLIPAEIQRIIDAAVESDSIKTVTINAAAIDVPLLRGSKNNATVEIDASNMTDADLHFAAGVLLENPFATKVIIRGKWKGADGMASVFGVFGSSLTSGPTLKSIMSKMEVLKSW